MTLDARTTTSVASPARAEFRGFDAAHGADFDMRAAALLIVADELGEDMSGRHRRKAGEPQPAHALRRGASESGKTAVRNARFICSGSSLARSGQVGEGY